jgi:Protein kinase G tetratricopeptide repeat/PBP superfamily domain
MAGAACSTSGSPGSPVAASPSAPGGGIPSAFATAREARSETGSTLLSPLMKAWAAAYQQQHPNLSIKTAATGSAKGIDEASADQVDIGGSDAYLSSGQLAAAGRYFQLVLTVDPAAYVSAAFGLARTRLNAGDARGAIAALAAVPGSSSYHLAAQVAAVRIQVASRPGAAQASPDDLRQAGSRLAQLKLNAIQLELLIAEILRAALDCVATSGPQAGPQLLGYDFTDRALRFGLERCYRAQARQVPDEHRRIELVDQANYVRPGTWT